MPSGTGRGAWAGLTTEPEVRARDTGARARKAKAVAATLLGFGLVFGACSPIVSPQPATPSPAQSLMPESTTRSVPPTSAPETEFPDPSAVVVADCGRVIAATEPRPAPKQGLAVYSTPNGLSLYSISSNSSAHLDASNSPSGLRPRFRTPRLVSFVHLRENPDGAHTFGQDSLVEFDLQADSATELLRFPNSLLAFDWNDDGTVLAYLLRTQTQTLVGPRILCSFDSRTGKTSVLRQIENPFGTSVGQREETAVAWSPGSEAVLVTDTAARPSLFIVTIDGRDTVEPRNGSFGRWLSDNRVLFQEDPQEAAAPWEWLALSAATGATRPSGFPSAAFRPAASPSGKLIAYDDGDADQPAVFVFDTETRATTHLADGFVAPIWIGPDVVAATAVQPCTSGEFCDIPWSPLESTVAIHVETGNVGDLALPTTLNEVARYGPIDVLLP